MSDNEHRLWFALYGVLATLAWLVTRADRRHRPLALFLTWMPLADLVRNTIRGFNAGAPRPLVGAHLLARHLDVGLVLSWSFPFIALALHYFTRVAPRLAFAAFLICWVACMMPQLTGPAIMDLYRLVTIGTMIAVWACVARAILRRDIEPRLAHLVILLYNATDFAVVLVPWMGNYVADWGVVRVATIVLLAVCVLAHAVWLNARRWTG